MLCTKNVSVVSNLTNHKKNPDSKVEIGML